jgi:dolichol-phosphate mannosyltransferase
MQARTSLITIVAPCYNEALGIDAFWSSLRGVLDACHEFSFQVVFVDDGSSDETLERLVALSAVDERVRVLSLTRNFGHQVALSAGLDHARGVALLFMDADLQHPPELIPALLAEFKQGHDIVSAVRLSSKGASLLKRLSSNAFYALFNKLSDTKIPPGAADFVCLSRRAYRQLRGMREQHRMLRAMIAWLGFPRVSVPYHAPLRVAGQSKYTLRKMVALALDGVFAFSTRPIRFGIRAGLAIASLGLVYLVYVLLMSTIYGATVRGWASILVTLLVLGGFQICMIGLVGEYVARSFEQGKGRPLYVLKSDSKRRVARRLSTGAPARSVSSARSLSARATSVPRKGA